jgi:WD40 repeat protein/serine/threonine protein kinase
MNSPTPNRSEHEAQLNEVIAAYLEEVEAGQVPDRAEWLARYPDLADDLRKFFANHDHLARVGEPLRAAAPAQPPTLEAATLAPDTSPAEPVPDTVRYFGDYELREEIARGGMGVVYRARQVSLNREVALKMILAGQLASEADVRRFRTEAEAAANLDHPNIVPIYEVGEHHGQHYFSMKLVPGGSLADRIPALVKDPKAAVRLVAAVTRAVHHAHQRGILHRDLKPGNVLIDTQGEPHVTDFGLAKRTTDAAGLTRSNAIVGTPSYMAPEQARSEKVLTTAVDVYSLGAILYELLTGRPPFRADTPLDTVLQVLEREPERPRKLNPDVDRDLETICLKCLDKDSNRRYNSASALADDLERWLAGEPIQARPYTRLERAVKAVRRRPARAAVVVALGLMAGWIFGQTLSHNWDLQRLIKQVSDSFQTARDAEQAARDSEHLAKENEQTARQSQEQAIHNLYLSQMGQAHLAWKDGQVGRVLDLLNAQKPERTGGHDLRGFEWYYLRRLCQAGQTVLVRQEQPFYGVAYSPDGKTVASTSGPLFPGRGGRSELKLWDVATGKEVRSFEDHASGFAEQTIAFSPDGTRIAAFGDKGGTRVWETQSGKVLQTFPMKRGSVLNRGKAFSPDGRYLAVADDKVIRLWDVQTGKERAPAFEPHTVYLTAIAFTPDGERLVAGAASQKGLFLSPPTVLVWDVKTGKRLLGLSHPGGVLSVAVSPDGRAIASAAFDLRVWDAESKKEKWTWQGPARMFSQVAFTPDGRWLLGGSWDGAIRVWNAATGSLVRTLRGHTLGVTGLAVRPDGRRVVSSGGDGTLRVWEWQRDQEALTVEEPLGPVMSLAFHPDGRHLASGSNGISLWDLPAGKVTQRFKHFIINFNTSAVAFSADGKRLATAGGAVKVWDTVSGKKLFGEDPTPFGKEEKGEDDLLTWELSFSPDGKYLASCGHGVKVRDAATGQLIRTLSHGRDAKFSPLISVAYSPDGKQVAAGGMGGVVALWDAASGQVVHQFPDFPDPVLKVSFREDGRRLFAASDSTVRVWELPSRQEVFHFPLTSSYTPTGRSTFGIGKASFSADGQRLATAPGDGTIALWDVMTGQQILSLSGPGTQVICVALSPDGRWLAAGGLDGTKGILRIWDARPIGEKHSGPR